MLIVLDLVGVRLPVSTKATAAHLDILARYLERRPELQAGAVRVRLLDQIFGRELALTVAASGERQRAEGERQWRHRARSVHGAPG